MRKAASLQRKRAKARARRKDYAKRRNIARSGPRPFDTKSVEKVKPVLDEGGKPVFANVKGVRTALYEPTGEYKPVTTKLFRKRAMAGDGAPKSQKHRLNKRQRAFADAERERQRKIAINTQADSLTKTKK